MKIKITRKSVFTRGEILLSIVITVIAVLIVSMLKDTQLMDNIYLNILFSPERTTRIINDFCKKTNRSTFQILFLDIDDKSLEELHIPWPVPRSLYARILDNLCKYRPRAIGMDIIFPDKSTSESSDIKLAESLKKHNLVILGRTLGDPRSPKITNPATILTSGWTPEMMQSRIGYVDSGIIDYDGVIRRVALLASIDNKTYLSFDVLLLCRYLGIPFSEVKDHSLEGYQMIGDIRIPVTNGEMWINFFNRKSYDSSSVFQSYKLVHFMKDVDAHETRTLEQNIKDNIIIIGFTAEQAYERQKSPLGETSGPEIHINILSTLISWSFSKSLTFSQKFIILLIPCIFLVVILPFLSPLTGFILYIAGNFAIFSFSHWIFDSSGIVPVPVTGWILLFLTYGLITVAYFMKTHKAKNRLKSLLLELAPVPEPVLERIMERFQGKVAMGGEKVELSILFSDIRGYTSLSQNLDPREVMNTLNEFYSAMGNIYKRNGGMLFDYMGDGQMVVFGADSPADDRHAFMAVKSAIEMCQELTNLNEAWKSKNRRSVDIGIGINTGEVSLGFLGSGQSGGRKQFAAIGDTTNVASRIEGLTKQYAANILISESTFEKSQEKIEVEPLPPTKVKGKDEPIKIFKVTGFKKSNE
ncbi:MAG: CHASE2 domain-containing protein [Vulcanimicrobiota bacterium]